MIIFVIMFDNLDFNRNIHEWVRATFPPNTVLATQIAYKVVFILLIFFILDVLLSWFLSPLIKKLTNNSKRRIYMIAYEKKVHRSIIHFIALGVTYLCIDYFFFPYHPQSFSIINRIFLSAIIIVFINLFFRIVNTLERYYQLSYNYKGTAMVTLLQSIKVFGYFMAFIALIMILFSVELTSILATLGATTAIFVLVFRDTILGIISGFSVATSRTIKVGDWISIPKYSLEGNVAEINLLTSKITNFDKTVSTIPTYDLINTEVKNLQILIDGNSRRILRSIYFDINSFKFMTDSLKEKWSRINLISDYIHQKSMELAESRKSINHADNIINGEQLTNIGVFRIYIENYLKNLSTIDSGSMIIVRQKPTSPQGLPLEIYCFTTTGNFESYERIQSDIFDHILVAAGYFELTILQTKI